MSALDRAKLALITIAASLTFAFLGVAGLGIAGAIALAPALGPAGGAAMMGVVFCIGAALTAFAYQKLRPRQGKAIAEVEEHAADALSGLPFDMVERAVKQRPLAVVTTAALAGFAMARGSEEGLRTVRRVAHAML